MSENLDATTLAALIAAGESSTLELKIAPPRPNDLAERLCGLANAKGGWIVLGVEDGTLAIRGVKDNGEAIDVLLRAARMCQPPIVFEPPEPQIFNLQNKNVVVAYVPASKAPVYQAGGVFWVRRGTHTVPHSIEEISSRLYSRGVLRWELSPAEGATLEDLDRQRIEDFLARRGEQSLTGRANRFRNLEDALVGLKCAIKEGDRYIPTNAGLLFFGFEPQQFLLQSIVTCVLYGDELGVRAYKDRKIFRGSLPVLIQEVEGWLKRHMPVAQSRSEGFRHVDVPEYSPLALREATVNAMIHRDYSHPGESVRLFYYPTRLEVHSPGELLPGITLEMLSNGLAPSRLRNPVIAGLLRDIPGYVETIGSGVRLMINEMREHRLPDPEFREMGELVVTFRSAASSPTSELVQPTYPTVANITSAFSKSEVGIEIGSLNSLPETLTQDIRGTGAINPAIYADVDERLKAAMQHVHTQGSITNRDYRAITGVSESTGMRDLEILVKRGSLRAVGQKKARRYILP